MSAADDIGNLRFVLPADLLIVPVTTLAESIRSGLEYKSGDYAVARPRSRRPSRILNAETAALLEEFRSPSRLVDAVLSFSRKRGLDPETCLEEAFPALQLLSRAQLLVTADSPELASIDATFAPDDIVDAFRIVMPLRVLDDTEVYFALDEKTGEHVALKLHRETATADPNTIEREAEILRHLDGCVGPKLVTKAWHQGRPLLVSTWCPGVPVTVLADELRRGPAIPDESALLTLALDVTAAYAKLHEAGVVHGDVNPANVLVDVNNVVSIIDFGAATLFRPGADPIGPIVRAAVGYFYDPQTAEAVAQRRLPPRATALGEQYALGVLLYRLFTGSYPVDFSAESEELMRQVMEDEPEGFSRRGVEPWPQVEEALARAMQKRPEGRFRDVWQFRAALLGADHSRLAGARGAQPIGSRRTDQNEAVLDALGFESSFLRDGGGALPRSIWEGRAGVAWLVYRGAMARADPSLLALADAWSTEADAPSSGSVDPALPNNADVAHASVLQSEGSLHSVSALVAMARCDTTTAVADTMAFLGHGDQTPLNVTLSAGFLEAAVSLERAAAANGIIAPAELADAIAKATNHLAELVAAQRSATSVTSRHLGFAHGVAGILYALLGAWDGLTDQQRQDVRNALLRVAEMRQPLGRGLVWPAVWRGYEAQRRTLDRAPGWCAGSAGFVHLWTRASRVLGDEGFLRLAEMSGWTAWEHPDRGASLCCGVPGRGIALLVLYRHTGDIGWRWKAEELSATLAPVKPSKPHDFGLFQGVIGGALLELELEQPEQATMPVCAL